MGKLDLKSYFNTLPWAERFSTRWAWFRDPRRDGGVWRGKRPPPTDGSWPDPQAHEPPYRRYANASFGLSPVPAWASTISGFLAAICEGRGVSRLVFYIDDFLVIADSKEECQRQLDIVLATIVELGLMVAPGKTEGPFQEIEFLGLQLSSIDGTITITEARCAALSASINAVLAAGRSTRRKLHTLQGKLGWCGMIVRGGRVFMRGLIDAVTATRHGRPSQYIAVNKDIQEDLEWWLEQLADVRWRGSRMWLREDDHTLLTVKSDASGHLGWGLAIGDELHFSAWSELEAKDPDMLLKELVPVLYMAETQGERLRNRIVRPGVDNSGAAFRVLGGSPRGEVRKLLRRVARQQAKYNFDLIPVHVGREWNTLADLLTRFLQATELQGELPAGWQLEMGEGSLRVSPWRLTPSSPPVYVLKLRQSSGGR